MEAGRGAAKRTAEIEPRRAERQKADDEAGQGARPSGRAGLRPTNPLQIRTGTTGYRAYRGSSLAGRTANSAPRSVGTTRACVQEAQSPLRRACSAFAESSIMEPCLRPEAVTRGVRVLVNASMRPNAHARPTITGFFPLHHHHHERGRGDRAARDAALDHHRWQQQRRGSERPGRGRRTAGARTGDASRSRIRRGAR